MASKPEVREDIVERLKVHGVVKGDRLNDIRVRLDMDCSNTEFDKALRSLHYKYRQVRISRPRDLINYGPRPYVVSVLV